jgi:thioredoxin-like negative regulator of GroEL
MDVTVQTFAHDLLERSREVPVVGDFCRRLAATL